MGKSYETVNYLLRLKKQIERKLIIETVQCLDPIIDVKRYHYFGFGSVYFADFIMFHKYLNINRMTSIDDKEEDERRFLFNKPFGFINFSISQCRMFLENNLNWSDKLFIWLDFDTSIDLSMIGNTEFVASKAKALDIFLITVKAESPNELGDFLGSFREYMPPGLTLKHVKEKFPEILKSIIEASIQNGLKNQMTRLCFLQFFNFTYEDTKKMYTFGGIFCSESDINNLKARLSGMQYIRYDNSIENIDCPILTPKEKTHIDACVQEVGISADTIITGITNENANSYRRYYKYYPQFFESVF